MATQNELSSSYHLGIDIRGRESELLELAHQDLGFEPAENGLLGYSTWWNSERAGAFRYLGTISGRATVLKVQGVRPVVSEITALEHLNSQSGQLLRAPIIYGSRAWDDNQGCELIAIEHITSPKLISYPTNQAQLETFFALYKDYRQNLRGNPWIKLPAKPLREEFLATINHNRQTAAELYPNYPHRQSTDSALINQAVQQLSDYYETITPEFQHLHITSDDIFLPNGNDPRHIVTSNFVWGWKSPFFDATAAYHHYNRLYCERAQNPTAQGLADQTDLWESAILKLATSPEEIAQLTYAMIGQLIGCLVISDMMISPQHPLAATLLDTTRQRLRHWLQAVA